MRTQNLNLGSERIVIIYEGDIFYLAVISKERRGNLEETRNNQPEMLTASSLC